MVSICLDMEETHESKPC